MTIQLLYPSSLPLPLSLPGAPYIMYRVCTCTYLSHPGGAATAPPPPPAPPKNADADPAPNTPPPAGEEEGEQGAPIPTGEGEPPPPPPRWLGTGESESICWRAGDESVFLMSTSLPPLPAPAAVLVPTVPSNVSLSCSSVASATRSYTCMSASTIRVLLYSSGIIYTAVP